MRSRVLFFDISDFCRHHQATRNGDLLSESSGFLDEVFGNEWEIVREPGVDPIFERTDPGDSCDSQQLLHPGLATHCILDVNYGVFPGARAANQYVSGGRRFERLGIIVHGPGNQPTFAIMADARPARPPNGNIAGLGQLE
jgi:hypothetical protein